MRAFILFVISWSLFVGILGNDSEGETRIADGQGSSMKIHPEIVSLHYNGFFHCAGLIYSERTVITTANCANRIDLEKGKLVVRAGNLRLRKKDSTEQAIAVDDIKLHPRYDKDRIEFNIAVLTLESSLKWNEYVQKVNIPDTWKEKWLIKHGICKVAGWGHVKGDRFPWKIQETTVSILSRIFCSSILETQLNITFPWNMICTADQGAGPCLGDTGGPLTCYDNKGDAYHVGMTAVYASCFSSFGMYTKLTKFRSWVAGVDYRLHHNR